MLTVAIIVLVTTLMEVSSALSDHVLIIMVETVSILSVLALMEMQKMVNNVRSVLEQMVLVETENAHNVHKARRDHVLSVSVRLITIRMLSIA